MTCCGSTFSASGNVEESVNQGKHGREITINKKGVEGVFWINDTNGRLPASGDRFQRRSHFALWLCPMSVLNCDLTRLGEHAERMSLWCRLGKQISTRRMGGSAMAMKKKSGPKTILPTIHSRKASFYLSSLFRFSEGQVWDFVHSGVAHLLTNRWSTNYTTDEVLSELAH